MTIEMQTGNVGREREIWMTCNKGLCLDSNQKRCSFIVLVFGGAFFKSVPCETY